jgi:hypothetical protein
MNQHKLAYACYLHKKYKFFIINRCIFNNFNIFKNNLIRPGLI